MGEGLSGSGRLHRNLRPRTVRPFFFSQFWNDLISWLGEGGVPALGERRLAEKVDHASVFNEVVALQVEHRIPNVLGEERHRYDHKLTMVVGAGASAATVLQSLKALGTTKVSSKAEVNDLLLKLGCVGYKKGR